MTQIINAHFDGKTIVPDEPIRLPIGQPLRLHVEVMEPTTPRFAELLQFGVDLPDAPSDLASKHDHYLYGTPKE